MTIPNRDDIVWLAGLLEGEGCFDLHKGVSPRVRLTMTDRDVVGRAASLFGSTARLTLRAAPTRSTWHAEKQGEAAAQIMAAVLPYMGARRSAKIAEVLAAYRLRRSDAYGQPFGVVPRPPGLADIQPVRELEAA